MVQKYSKLKEWPQVSAAKFTLHHFCCILLWFAQQQPWVWKDKSFKTVLCHMSKLFLFLIKAPACLKASPPPKSFFSCYTFIGMCCLTVKHFSLSISSPTCTLKLFWHSPQVPHVVHLWENPTPTHRFGFCCFSTQQNRTGRGEFCIFCNQKV